MSEPALRHPLLESCGVEHGFGVRGARAPEDCVRPRQVHGCSVARARPPGAAEPSVGEADAIVSVAPGPAVAVVTADCVPVLAARTDGRGVLAIHAGWRGLAAGVVEAGIAALAAARGGDAPGAGMAAVIGPHIGPCCYEVDEPVLRSLAPRLGAGLEAVLTPSRPGHCQLDLGKAVRQRLLHAGLADDAIGLAPEPPGSCTRCHPERFHSYRRDGERAGRLVHFIRPAAANRQGASPRAQA